MIDEWYQSTPMPFSYHQDDRQKAMIRAPEHGHGGEFMGNQDTGHHGRSWKTTSWTAGRFTRWSTFSGWICGGFSGRVLADDIRHSIWLLPLWSVPQRRILSSLSAGSISATHPTQITRTRHTMDTIKVPSNKNRHRSHHEICKS